MATRIVSALIMAFIVIFGIFKLSSSAFNAIAFLLMLGGLWEWRKLCMAGIGAFAASVAGMILLYVAYSMVGLTQFQVFILLGVGMLFWIMQAITLPKQLTVTKTLCLLKGMFCLSIAWLAMVLLRDQFGEHTLMLVLLMVWSADTFAYFGGKRFGKTKLAPSISPGKTREGAASGLLMSMVVAVCYTHFFIEPLNGWIQMFSLLIVAALVALISVVGDLSESKLKRAAGMKDSGTLIPGHGGILDRIDGLIAGIVIYAFYAVMMRALI